MIRKIGNASKNKDAITKHLIVTSSTKSLLNKRDLSIIIALFIACGSL